MKAHTIVRGLSLTCVLLASTVLGACTFSVDAETGKGNPVIPDTRLGVRGHIGSDGLGIDQADPIPPGGCVKVVWLDSRGRPIGSSEATVGGGTVPIPEGAKDARFERCDEEDVKQHVADADRVASGPRGTPTRRFYFRDMPIDWDDGQGLWIEYTIQASSRQEADAIAADYRSGLLERPRPANVEMGPTVEARILGDGRLRITALLASVPTAADLTWNGEPLFTLADAQVVSTSGMHAAVFTVPAELVETPFLPGSSTNTLEITTSQAEGSDWFMNTTIETSL